MNKIKPSEYVSEKEQLSNIKLFGKNVSDFGIDLVLNLLCTFFENQSEIAKQEKIDGKLIIKTKIFKTHYPLILQVKKSSYDVYKSFEVFDYTQEEIDLLKKTKKTKEEVIKCKELNKNKLLLNPRGETFEEKKNSIFTELSNLVNLEKNKKLVETISFSNENWNSILNGLEEYKKINKKISESMNDPEMYQFVSLRLYGLIFEVYVKILKGMYSKIKQVKFENINNKDLYSFFNKNYPILLKSTNNKLRNDIHHGNYDPQILGKYSIEEVDQERKEIYLKVTSALIAEHDTIISLFQEITNKTINLNS